MPEKASPNFVLDYHPQRPSPPKPGGPRFWAAFIIAYGAGMIVLIEADELIHRYAFGNESDGGIMAIGAFFFPVFGAILRLLRINRRFRSITFGVCYAIFSPTLVYFVVMAFIRWFRA